MDFVHIPVLLHEVLEGLAIRPDGIYVDGTVGGAGHSTEIAKRLTAGGKLIGFDRDPDAVEVATQRLAPYPATVVSKNAVHVYAAPSLVSGISLGLATAEPQRRPACSRCSGGQHWTV